MIGYFISRTTITVIKSFRQTNDVLNYKHVTFIERDRLEKKSIFQAVLHVGKILKDSPRELTHVFQSVHNILDHSGVVFQNCTNVYRSRCGLTVTISLIYKAPCDVDQSQITPPRQMAGSGRWKSLLSLIKK